MEALFSVISVAVYCLLAILATWGGYCVIMVWRRVAAVRFRDEAAQDEFLDALDVMLAERGVEEAVASVEQDRRALPQLTLFALLNRHVAARPLKRMLVERFQQDVLSDIDNRLSWVGTVVKAAPMVGLLGTVIGMMGAFANISIDQSVDQNAMARDIHFALITTACGLAIAVPLVLATQAVAIRLRTMEELIGVGLARLFDVLGDFLEESDATTTPAAPPPVDRATA